MCISGTALLAFVGIAALAAIGLTWLWVTAIREDRRPPPDWARPCGRHPDD